MSREDAVWSRGFQEIDHPGIVVSGERDDTGIGFGGSAQELQNLIGLRPAIDIIAERDDPPVRGLISRYFAHDPLMHLTKQIEASMNVPDRIDTHSFRRGGVGKNYAFISRHRPRSHGARA